MARMKPQALRAVSIDGQSVQVPENSVIEDVVPRDVKSISTIDSVSGSMRLITRDQFRQVVPEGFMTHMTAIAKGGTQHATQWRRQPAHCAVLASDPAHLQSVVRYRGPRADGISDDGVA